MNRVQIAALMGVHEDTVTDFARNGMPVMTRGGHGKEGEYDAVECLAWHREHQGLNAKEAAQTRLYEANALNAEQKARREREELVSKDAIVLAGQAVIAGLRAKLLNLAVRLRHQGYITRESEAGVREICRADLKDIEAWQLVSDAIQPSTERTA